MRLSLRKRVLVLVFLINAGLFGAGGLFLLQVQVAQGERLVEQNRFDLEYALRGAIRPREKVNVAYILRWRYWETVEDAILIDDAILSEPGAGSLERGFLNPSGVAISPAGRARRPADFDQQAALAAIVRAMREETTISDVEGGQAVPIIAESGVWGGFWYRASSRVDHSAVVASILPWFVVSTLLLTGGTFLALRRLVLAPVEQLADGARRVRSGDFSVRLAVPARRDEMADLVRSFNDMTSTVQGFNERLEDEVRVATEKALKAEAAAMTQRRLAAMGELAAGIAHEINNPLGGLQNAVETLRRDDLSPEKRERYLELLASGLGRIAETVSRLRRFTPRRMELEPFDLVPVAQDAIALVRHRAERLGVSIAFTPPLGGVGLVVTGSRTETGQALLNLLANSLDSLEEGGSSDPAGPRIEVALSRQGDHALVEVRDNGHGVGEDALGQVADLFYTTKDVGKGTGLGLSLVHKTMLAQGGRVDIASEEGRGFVVELRFPLPAGRRDPAEGSR